MRTAVLVLGRLALIVAAIGSLATSSLLVIPASPVAATNGYGPGLGAQTPGVHWGGGYDLQGVPGYGYCISPGAADPVELPTTTWSPVAYPGSSVFTDGQMAALAYFADRYQGTGFDGYSVNQTVGAIAQIAYASAGAITPATGVATPSLVADIETWMNVNAGPWTIGLTMNPASGSTFTGGTEYSGVITVTSSTGNGVAGLSLSMPPVGGPQDGQISSFGWSGTTTNSAGQLGFVWNIIGGATPVAFSAPDITVLGGAPGLVPPTYGAPAGSGGQRMVVSGAGQTLAISFAGTVSAQAQTGSISIHKTVPDPAYYGPGGAVFHVLDANGTVVGSLTTGSTGSTPMLSTLPATASGTRYGVQEITAPPGYGLAPAQAVMVSPGADTVVSFAGPYEEPILVGQLGATKIDAQTQQPLAGAVFDFSFDADNNGTFSEGLGSCTTGASGTCQPPTRNAPGGWLPGRYRITETAAPPGYWLDPQTATTETFLQPGASDLAAVTFSDPQLVAASFRKVAVGNVNPAELDLAGAVIDVTPGAAYGGTPVGTCSTGPSEGCTTATVLISGQPYCWEEVTAPPGLASGATGCFTATDSQASEPITVTDSGLFVAIRAVKLDAAAPATTVPGATIDLYRMGGGPTGPTAPSNAEALPGGTWVARAVTGAYGAATFPLQLPGYSYCTLEQSPPADYEVDTTPQCTGTLNGSSAVPAPVITLTTADLEATVTLGVHKYNAASPTTGIPGARYDLYVQGEGPPAGPVATPPSDVAAISGERWWARGITGTSGELDFTVPAGYSWCVKEISAPLNYLLDPGLHCTGVVTTASSASALTLAVPETVASVQIFTHKFDASTPHVTVPGATYELVGVGALPPGWSAPANPDTYPVPAGDWYVGTATTNATGTASWTVPAGYSWCLHEVSSPTDYQLDAGWHCTAVITTRSTPTETTVALPEIPIAIVQLAYTGGPPVWLAGGGLGLVGIGGTTAVVGRRRRRPTR